MTMLQKPTHFFSSSRLEESQMCGNRYKMHIILLSHHDHFTFRFRIYSICCQRRLSPRLEHHRVAFQFGFCFRWVSPRIECGCWLRLSNFLHHWDYLHSTHHITFRCLSFFRRLFLLSKNINRRPLKQYPSKMLLIVNTIHCLWGFCFFHFLSVFIYFTFALCLLFQWELLARIMCVDSGSKFQ